VTPDIRIPFTGRDKRRRVRQDLERVSKLKEFQRRVEDLRAKGQELTRKAVKDLLIAPEKSVPEQEQD
jgi:hypothetical protein